MKQESFSVGSQGYKNNKEAIKARNARAKELKQLGYTVKCWTLPNYKKYSPNYVDGILCNLYMINIYDN